MGEHSPVDALVPSIVCEYAVVEGIDGGDTSEDEGAEELSAGGWERLEWVVDERIERECRRAELDARALIADSDTNELWFTDYGADWIKDVGTSSLRFTFPSLSSANDQLYLANFAPDAYIQMAFQLAWYKTRGEFTATYETALTRMFSHGRTETIRTLTADSRAWVLSMVDCEASVGSFPFSRLLGRLSLRRLELMYVYITANGALHSTSERSQNTWLPNSQSGNRQRNRQAPPWSTTHALRNGQQITTESIRGRAVQA